MKNFSDSQLSLVDEALRNWSDLMLDRAPHPGDFELHLLPVDLIAEAKGSGLPSNMNRYLARSVDMDAVSSSKSAFVYVKMCKLILIGFVRRRNSREWRGTRVAMKQGTIAPGRRAAPGAFWYYLADRARRMSTLRAKISARQKDKISTTMRAATDRAAASESFKAMSHDVAMFGRVAFEEPEE